MLHVSKAIIMAVCLTLVTWVIAYIAWGESMGWRISTRGWYELFPLLGLLAFSILWSQYIVLAVSRVFNVKPGILTKYFTTTGWIFLVLIFLHPGLLVWQLWRDGLGLPPQSYLKHYVMPGLEWAVLLGSVSFLLFLAFELRRWYGDRPWWKYMTYATDIAALAIFLHGLKLGGTLQQGWFHYVWLFYGVTLFVALLWLRIYPILQRTTK